MLTLFEFEFKLFFHLQGVLTENYEFANMKTERKFNKTMMNLYAFLFWDAYRFFIFIFRKGNEKCYIKKFQAEDFGLCQMTFLKNINWTVVTLWSIVFWFLLLHFWCINNIKARNEKSEWKKWWFFNENLRLLDRFWGGFQAVDFKAG